MYTRTFTKYLGLVALVVASACGSSGTQPDKPTTPAKTETTSTASTAKTPVGNPKRGLEAPDNDPALVALAREALKCYRKGDCEAQAKWFEPFHKGQQVDSKTLVNLIEDEHADIRSMAAGVLRGKKGQPGFHRDAVLARRVLDALDKEEDEYVAREIALAAGFIEVKATGLEERMVKIMNLDTRERVRIGMIESILHNNWDVPGVTAAVKGLSGDSSSDVRVATVRAFDVPELRAEACPFWTSNLSHQDASLADKCFYYLISTSCKGEYEAMLREAEKRPPSSPENFQPFCQQVDPNDAFTKKLIDDADKWANTTTLNAIQRSQSLKLLAKCDPERAKKVVAGLTKDKEDSVRETALELEKELKKKKKP